ncbi:TPA: hypothetical protein QDB26_004069 [Burkholderia vietnamiensis]|nr:hypothetical protein [Burkholderia vietnamiensis]
MTATQKLPSSASCGQAGLVDEGAERRMTSGVLMLEICVGSVIEGREIDGQDSDDATAFGCMISIRPFRISRPSQARADD